VADGDADNYDLGNMRRVMTEKLQDKILLKLESVVAGNFDDTEIATADYSAGVTLAATAQFSSNSAGTNPIPIFDTGALTILGNSGAEANFKIVPKEVYLKMKAHTSVVDRIKYTSKEISEGIVSALLGSGEMLVPTARYDSSAEGVTASIGVVWTDNCFIGYKPSSPSIMDPARCQAVEINGSGRRVDQSRDSLSSENCRFAVRIPDRGL